MSQASRLAGYMNSGKYRTEQTRTRQGQIRKKLKKVGLYQMGGLLASLREAMNQAFRLDVDNCQADVHLNWVDLLAYLGTRYGGIFPNISRKHMTAVAENLKKMVETTIEELTKRHEILLFITARPTEPY